MKGKRILILTGIFPPDIGGPAGYTRYMADFFSNNGNQVSVLTFGDNRKNNFAFHIYNVSRKIPRPLRDFIFFFYALKLAIRSDIIFDNGAAYDTGYIAVFISAIIKIPVITKIVGDGAWEFGRRKHLTNTSKIDDFLNEKKIHPVLGFLRIVQKIVWNRTNFIIVPSYYLKKIIKKYGIESDRIRVIYNNINVNKKMIGDCKFDFDSESIYFLTAARLVIWKGIDNIIKAFSRLPKKTKLIIAGDGPLKDELKLLCKKENLESRVIFLGNITQKEVITLMSKCTGFILGSSYEGLPHVILEAFAVGCPVIATNAGGTKELIQGCSISIEFGNIDELEKAILELYNNEKLRKTIIREQYEKYNKITETSMEIKTLKLFDELV